MRRFTAMAFVSLLGCGLTLDAQTVSGVVTDATGRPVSGGLVTLIAGGDSVRGRALTGETGAFVLSTSIAGTYTIRVLRIGYRPWTSAPMLMTSGSRRTETVRIDFLPARLDTLRVAARSACTINESGVSTEALTLWEQARGALMLTQLTSASRNLNTTSLSYERVLEPNSRRVRTQTVRILEEYATRPWRAIALDTLRREGYVKWDADESATYFAPDLEVLLSPQFLADHCLRPVRATDSTEIGLAFAPHAGRRQVPEIGGALWMERESGRLRRVDFSYVNIPSLYQQQAGGTLRFSPMRSGEWVISQWEIRMPMTQQPAPKAVRRVTGVQSVGGELIVARRKADTLYARALINVRGTVRDSVSGSPIGRAAVSLVGAQGSAVTNDGGQFEMRGLLPGDFDVEVRTAAMDSVGARLRRAVTIVDSATTLALTLPTIAQLTASVCGVNFASKEARGTGALIGRLQWADATPRPAPVKIAVEWTDQSVVRGRIDTRVHRLETQSDSTGAWRVCNVPTEALLSVRALPTKGRAHAAATRLSPDERFKSVEILVDQDATPTASLTGVVIVRDSTKTPIREAEIVISGVAQPVRTNARGEFRMDDIPVGAQQLQIRRLGFSPLSATLTFTANTVEMRTIELSRVTVLDSVDVRAEYKIPSFEEHKAVGLGHFLTRDDLAKMENRTLSAVLANFSGTKFIQGRGTRVWLARARGVQSMGGADLKGGSPEDIVMGAKPACYAHVYVDRVPMYLGRPGAPLFNLSQLSPDRIEAIEYYSGAAQTPPEYSGLTSTCGVLVIWTRRQ